MVLAAKKAEEVMTENRTDRREAATRIDLVLVNEAACSSAVMMAGSVMVLAMTANVSCDSVLLFLLTIVSDRVQS